MKNKLTKILVFLFTSFFVFSTNIYCQNHYQINRRYDIGLHSHWPILKSYEGEYTNQVALPLGGIGTGVVYLSGRGELKDWSIMNRPGFNYDPTPGFFCIYAKEENENAQTKILEGPISKMDFIGEQGSSENMAGLPRFEKHMFETCYPFGRVVLSDNEFPVNVSIEAFNPFIPANIDDSGIPIAVFRFIVSNKSQKNVEISIAGSLKNFIGNDGLLGQEKENTNTYVEMKDLKGILFSSEGVNKCAEQNGTMALSTSKTNSVSYRTNWIKSTKWFKTDILDFWDDFSSDGLLEECQSKSDSPIASLAVNKSIKPGEQCEIEFYLTWHFPNRNKWDWEAVNYPADCDESHQIGNYYTTKYTDALDVALKTASRLPKLEENTILFVNSLTDTDFPETIKEAALFNLANLRSQTMFMDAQGRFFGFEGQKSNSGGWPGNCTHVYNYEQAIPFLYGELAKSMRKTEFKYATDSIGKMAFRVNLPLNDKSSEGLAAADGQMGCLMKLYRDWKMSGDDKMLEELYPIAKKVLEFSWIEGGWDANKDGVMEGCQHNTMDIDYFGPNPQMGVWYLGALRAMEELAYYMKDNKFAKECQKLYTSGSEWIDSNLFNGEYYEQKIQVPQAIANNLKMHSDIYGENYEYFQLDKGCLVDQLVGQYMAHICGLGYLVKEENVLNTLNSIYKYNLIQMDTLTNNMRAFALNKEKGLVMASYPRGRNKFPFPYFSEVMSGFEYSTAAHMIYEGMTNKAIECISEIRNRHNGENRNPFNEFEAGFHYARAMASWASIPAYTGFQYSGVDKTLILSSKDGKYFWSNGYAWGNYQIEEEQGKTKITFSVDYGSLELKNFKLKDERAIKFKKSIVIRSGEELIFEL